MKGMTKVTIALAVVLVIVIAAGGYEWGRSRQAAKDWKAREAIYNERIADKDATLAARAGELSVIKEELTQVSADIVALKADAAKDKASIAERDKQLRDLPPEHLVSEARALLNTDGITISADGDHIVFTIAAFTEAVVRVAKEQKLSMEYVPKLEATIKAQDAKILKLEAGMANLEGQVKTWSEKYDTLKSAFDDFKKVKERSWLTRAMDTGGKVAVGIVAGFVLAIAR
jgi:uncharacterized protein HemX